jgi:heme oxygenase
MLALRRLDDLHTLAKRHARALDERSYLRAMYGFHAPIEELVAADTPLPRREAPRLLRHLRALGDHAPPAWCPALPDTSTMARRIGIAYVLHGRRFGATAEQLLVTRGEQEDAVAAATETLRLLLEWLKLFTCCVTSSNASA